MLLNTVKESDEEKRVEQESENNTLSSTENTPDEEVDENKKIEESTLVKNHSYSEIDYSDIDLPEDPPHIFSVGPGIDLTFLIS